MIEQIVFDATGLVAMEKFADDAPDGTTTWTGTVMEAELSVRFTEVPPVGAFADNVMIPWTLLPPRIEVGETVKAVRID